jgi:hypothetical protein
MKLWMEDYLRSKISNWLIFIIISCGFTTLALDKTNSKKPLIPDPAVGRTVSHAIKWRGTVFLTPQEYAPYRWIIGIIFLCIALLFFIQIFYYAQKRFLRTPRL